MIRRLEVPAPDFSLRHTLECGQAFRWRRAGASYAGFLSNCPVKVTQHDAQLIVETIDPALTESRIRRYFALDVALGPILDSIDVDGQIHEAIARGRGLRILRQDSWECLASFILSSFNNIARIQGMIERLCQAYGAAAGFNGYRGFAFPTPEAIAGATERRLRELGLGFRAPYLRSTARLVADGQIPLETLRRTDYALTRSALLRCDGVGEKVADCVALFGFEKYEAFPIDLWIERAMRYYFQRRKLTPKRMHDFAAAHFGRYAGYAQQYLYHYVRTARRPAAAQGFLEARSS
jgi:N-glycosylase/DNA lyase